MLIRTNSYTTSADSNRETECMRVLLYYNTTAGCSTLANKLLVFGINNQECAAISVQIRITKIINIIFARSA